jgi:hypothetical protein
MCAQVTLTKTGLSAVRTFNPLGVKFIFPVFCEELIHVAMWMKFPTG